MRKKGVLIFMSVLAVACLCVTVASCDKNESYAEKLDNESKASNAYLSGFDVVNEIPADTIFEEGEDAPFYRIEEEGNVYMQVIKAGDRDSMAHTGDKIFLRFSRFDVLTWLDYGVKSWGSNSSNMASTSAYFYYNDFSKSASTTWGIGVQLPLQYVGINSEINLLIKSQYGPSEEMSSVTPYLWNVRYFKSAL